MKLFLLFALFYFPHPHSQKAFMVWDGQNQAVCPLTIEVLPSLKLEIPLDENGKLLPNEAKVTGIVAKYISKCGRIEIKTDPTAKSQSSVALPSE